MFEAIGKLVYRYRFLVIGGMVSFMVLLFLSSLGMGDRLSKSGWFDPTSESSATAAWLDEKNGRDHFGDVVLMMTAPEGEQVSDPQFIRAVSENVQSIVLNNPGVIKSTVGFTDLIYGSILPANISAPDAKEQGKELADAAWKRYSTMKPADRKVRLQLDQDIAHAVDPSGRIGIINVSLTGNSDDEVASAYEKLSKALNFDPIEKLGGKVQIAGVQPVTVAIFNQMDKDVKRAEMVAIPAVAILLFLVFGGVIAMGMPLIVGGLTILGSDGLLNLVTYFTPVSTFAGSIISLIGLGIATDYGLFIVSRFREELAEGYSTKDAVRRSVMSSGRTVTMSALLILVALLTMLVFPQMFLRSAALGAIFAVGLAMTLSITVLPAILGVLGPRIDMWSIPALRRAKTRKEIMTGFWGKLIRTVLKRPLLTTIPVVAALAFLIIPLNNIDFGGLTQKYLPPSNPTRAAQDQFDEMFPSQRTYPVKVVIFYATPDQVSQIQGRLNQIPGFAAKFEKASQTEGTDALGVTVLQAPLRNDAYTKDAMKVIRQLNTPVPIQVTGFNVLAEDSISGVFERLPLMIGLLVGLTALIMFLSFGSVVLPIKAVIMSALTLLSTMGVLTWIFTEGHFSGVFNFTALPLMSVVLVIIIAIIFGLSTDYEIFLVSRMIEEREKGATTPEAIVAGTAQTGRIITAAACILIVVTGAFALSDLVLMKYIAFGLIFALVLDATIVRMFFVPAVMMLLGEDCWWAPEWLRRIQERIGLGEVSLSDEVGSRWAREQANQRYDAVINDSTVQSHDPLNDSVQWSTSRSEPQRIGPHQG